ncbi:hydantoinase/oxoprolinase family protein [Actinophytocola sp.]|uniref:hydantoinase/oxoprolinase family protein n=1 Tax=Actinophytocola sp. TaxID=1872138 RepID=UPI003D6C2CB5
MSTPDLRIGIDIGGTFTDFTLIDSSSGRIEIGKTLSTPGSLIDGVTSGLAALRAETGIEMSDVSFLVHGTTAVTNALIERKGCRIGLLCTQGARDVIAIGREFRYDIYDLAFERPEPLVARTNRLEIPERIDATGQVRKELDRDAVLRAVTELRARGVRAIAIAFLHSHVNPTHEQETARLVRAAWPEVALTVSSDIVPEIREYERTSTAVANAYVQPLVAEYLKDLEDRLRQDGLAGQLYVMLSSGGLSNVADATAAPVKMVESGPAGGALAAQYFSRLVGEKDYVSFDMGGTTAKMCAIRDGALPVVHEFESARVKRFKAGSGIPLKVPVIDMIEIGAGGGSVAWVDEMDLLKVGPQSAGASPGPVSYGRGGELPTITDADAVLGLLNPDYFLGGTMRLDVDAARRAIEEKVADRIGQSVTEAAAGIIEVVTENMASAMRLHLAEKGHDLRGAALFAFGGAGPVHAYRLAQVLGMDRVIYPFRAGVLSSLGFLVAPKRFDFTHSAYFRLDSIDWAAAQGIVEDLVGKGTNALRRLDVPAADMELLLSVDMRFVGQGHEIEVPVAAEHVERRDVDAIMAAFVAEYQDRFGRVPATAPLVEILTWRLVATGPVPTVELGRQDSAATGETLKSTRPVYFAEVGDYLNTPVYDRLALRPGTLLTGPAVVEEKESTAVIGPGATITTDEHRTLSAKLPDSGR